MSKAYVSIRSSVYALLAVAIAAMLTGAPANRIEILPSGEKGGFLPSVITVWAGDQLSIRNVTAEDHEPGVINKDGKFVGFLPRPLKAGAVSSVFSPTPAVDEKNIVHKYSIHYVCRLHKNEQGDITVIPAP